MPAVVAFPAVINCSRYIPAAMSNAAPHRVVPDASNAIVDGRRALGHMMETGDDRANDHKDHHATPSASLTGGRA